MIAAIYRLYDRRDELLYVGISNNVLTRLRSHEKEKDWWPEVVRITIQECDDYTIAEAQEVAAIASELPRYNKSNGATNKHRRVFDPSMYGPKMRTEAAIRDLNRRILALENTLTVDAK